jgi:hypothetical protein
MASALSNLPLLHQQIRDWRITRMLTALSVAVVMMGLMVMLLIRAFGF